MKKTFMHTLLMLLLVQYTSAQNWSLSGNSGLTNANFLGTTDAKDVIFKVNNAERGRLASGGFWRFGSASNFARIDSAGKLTFGGNGVYQVAGNKYAFQYTGNPNYGLFFNSTNVQYEFRNGSAVPVFYVNANTGNGVFNGSLKIGAYTLPSTDGTNGQVLKTNGSGNLSWSSDNNTVYTAGNGISISGNVISNTTGKVDAGWPYNVSYGYQALFNLTTGYSNTATGYQSLINNTTGYDNTATGVSTLVNNTTGYYNTATGSNALFNNISGRYNTANGYGALNKTTSGIYNTATGAHSLRNNTEGGYNTANGYNALNQMVDGDLNVAIGAYALFHATEAHALVAIGDHALYNQVLDPDGYYSNTAIGSNALYYNTTGNYNTATGSWVLEKNTTGFENAAYGASALQYNTTGEGNTANGTWTLWNNITGNYNSAFGYDAGVSTGNLENATAIGAFASVDASNKVRIGNGNVESIGGQVGWTSFSDGRYKKNIKEDVKGLAFINALRPVTYTLDLQAINDYHNKNRKNNSIYKKAKADFTDAQAAGSKIIRTGFIAQEVEAAALKLNYDFDGVDKPQTKDGVYGLRYAEFVVPLVKAVQELSKMNIVKDEKIDSLQNRVTNIEDELKQLRALVLQIQQCSPCTAATSTSPAAINKQSIVLSDAAALEQNAPNPFRNITTIGYTLPQKFASAKIIVTDKNGRSLKQVNLTAAGKGTVSVDASIMAAGAYNYALYVDGKLVGSKQMVLTK